MSIKRRLARLEERTGIDSGPPQRRLSPEEVGRSLSALYSVVTGDDYPTGLDVVALFGEALKDNGRL